MNGREVLGVGEAVDLAVRALRDRGIVLGADSREILWTMAEACACAGAIHGMAGTIDAIREYRPIDAVTGKHLPTMSTK